MDLASPLKLARRSICSSCLRQLRRQATSQPFQTRNVGHIARPGEQASPISGYYADLSTTLPSTSHPAPLNRGSLPSTPTTTEKDDIAARARIVFGSRLEGANSPYRMDKERKSTNVAGILVPPRPDEPDNCCMSGCVNCVWDVYREDLEEWAAKAAEARAMLAKQGKSQTGADATRIRTPASKVKGGGTVTGPASMDDDGGGSETNWDLGSPDDGDLFRDIPVGIREFMRTEKALKERHAKEAHA